MRYSRILSIAAFLMTISPIYPDPASALTPNYQDSITIAENNANDPANWTAASLITTGSSGLQYTDSGKLIVRTATRARNLGSTYVRSDATVYGTATRADWVTTGNDMTNFIDTNGSGLTGSDLTELIERGLGMDNNAADPHDAILEYGVSIADDNSLIRPTKNPDITQYLPDQYGAALDFFKPDGMSDDIYTKFKAYYVNWVRDALTNKTFPFTQLGYTFYWGNGSSTVLDIQGMTEFIILGGTSVEVNAIYSTQSYIYTKNSGQYGNGYASFDVTGNCDSLWSGYRFQKKVLVDTVNTITVGSGSAISGGQGILVWSLNYTLDNSGIISGATSAKLGTTGTSNIAVLFKGGEEASSGAAALAGKSNTLINSGTISSPGTAVKIEAGATSITNTGTISGTDYGIDIASTSTVDITNTGGTISSDDYAIYIANTSLDTVVISGGTVSGKITTGIDHADTLTVSDGATLGFVLDRDTDGTPQIVSGDTTIAESTGVTLAPTIGGTANIQDGEAFLFVDAETLTTTVSNLAIQNDSTRPMITFTARKSGDQLYLDAARDNTYYANNSGNASLGRTVDSLANTATGAMADMIGSLDGSGSASNAQQLEPVNATNGGTTQAGYQTSLQFINTVLSHFDNVASGKIAGLSGIARENAKPKEAGIWAQGFDTYLHQFATGISKGYTANVAGFSAGYDAAFLDNFIFGFKGGLAWDTIRSRGPNTSNKVNSYEGGVYGSYGNENYYVDGIASFAYNDYSAKRHVSLGGANYDPRAEYGGWQYSLYGETGYTFELGKFRFTPLASLQYMRLDVDGYTEEDGGAANLKVDKQGYNLLETGLGARLFCILPARGFTFIPDVHFKWLYDAINDGEQVTSTFTGGGAAFDTTGYKPPKTSYNIGTRWVFLTKKGFTFSVNYDCQLRSDFYSNSGYGNVRYDF